MIQPRILFVVLLLAVVSALRLDASDIAGLSFDDLSSRSTAIVTGACISSASRWDATKRMIVTDSVFRIDRYLKGSGPFRLRITLPGGELPELNLGMTVSGMPRFNAGEEVLLFLSGNEPNRTVYGMAAGKHIIQRDAAGNRRVRGELLDTVIGRIERFLKNPGR